MQKISLFVLLSIVLAVNSVSYCQTAEFKVERTKSFSYNNKPITPEALLPFLPGMESDDTIRPWIINLRDSVFKLKAVEDTGKFRTGWISCQIDYDNYTAGSIAYKVVGKTKDEKFVLLVYSNGGGTLTFPYVFVLKLDGDKIIRVGNFLAEPLYQNPDEPVEIKGNEIINGKIHYTIPK